MFKTTIGRLRMIGIIEGISFLALLFIAMPMKYWGDIPEAVTIVGAVHGLLFALYYLAVIHVWVEKSWPMRKVALAAIAAILPFGPFVLDHKVLKHEV
jgi:integral membrane protein